MIRQVTTACRNVETIHGNNVPTGCGLISIFEETPTKGKHINKLKAKTETDIKSLQVRKKLTTLYRLKA